MIPIYRNSNQYDTEKNILWFKEVSKKDVAIVGGKAAQLGELYNARFPVPPGFCITVYAFKYFLEENRLKEKIYTILDAVDVDNTEELQKTAEAIQEIILNADMPRQMAEEIKDAYSNLDINLDVYRLAGKSTLQMIKAGRSFSFVAVRSSATAEDLPTASFAGQQKTLLNIRGSSNLINAVRECWASLFTARAIYYRVKNKFEHRKVLIAVAVQKMVNATKAGVAFSINPATNNLDEIVIEAGFGLGEAVVSGAIKPDIYIVDKLNFDIKDVNRGDQEWAYFLDENLERTVKRKVKKELVLSEQEIKELARITAKIEEHYKAPQDVEWVIEGERLAIVQTRPVTTISKIGVVGLADKKAAVIETTAGAAAEVGVGIKSKPILNGLGASPGIGCGKVKLVKDASDLNKIEKGDVLVAEMTNPDYTIAMQKAAAIVTNQGGLTSHASIVSRELGIPCVVGTEKATVVLHDGMLVTVDGARGEVYTGLFGEYGHITETKIEKNEAEYIELTKTKIYMNLGEPDKIYEYKDLNFDGIGLMRLEFVISSKIKEHPNYLLETGGSDKYTDGLAEAISTVARVIAPRPVVVRFSDFKTNEYRNLTGGEKYEVHEANPMLGWRGVSRYISEEFEKAFRLECKAIKKVLDAGNNNILVMLPFVRNKWEVEKCISIIADEKLKGPKLKIWLMAEVPSVALIPEEFAKLPIAGASIGSNDLTQLVLGVDRDSAMLGKMGYFNENDPAVLEAIKRIIDGFKKHGKTVSICGQAPSVYPQLVEFLIKNGIDSISVNPDAVNKTRRMVADIERQILI